MVVSAQCAETTIPSVRLGDTTSGIPAFCTGKSCTAGACIVGSTAAVIWHRDGTHVQVRSLLSFIS